MKPYTPKSWYTVLLRRPDYIARDDNDNWMGRVLATSPRTALTQARKDVAKADKSERGTDYLCLCLLKGRQVDLNPERV